MADDRTESVMGSCQHVQLVRGLEKPTNAQEEATNLRGERNEG